MSQIRREDKRGWYVPDVVAINYKWNILDGYLKAIGDMEAKIKELEKYHLDEKSKYDYLKLFLEKMKLKTWGDM